MSTKPTIFFCLDEPLMVHLISKARSNICYVAPAISVNVAGAIVGAKKSITSLITEVILDSSAQSLDLGYGEVGGVNLLIKSGIEVRCQPDLRLGVLVVDDRSCIFAPTPEIILEPPSGKTLNAININQNMTSWLRHAVSPIQSMVDQMRKEASNASESEPGLSEDIEESSSDDSVLSEEIIGTNEEAQNNGESADDSVLADSLITETKTDTDVAAGDWAKPEIGLNRLDGRQLEMLNDAVEKRGPKKFDQTREILVYNGYLQFVDLKFSGGRLPARTIQLPEHLLTSVKAPDDLIRLRASCRLFEDINSILPEVKEFERKVSDVRRCYMRHLGERLGSVVLTRDRQYFDDDVKDLRDELEDMSKRIHDRLSTALADTKERIFQILLPIVLNQPPYWLKRDLETRNCQDQRESCAVDFLSRELMWVIPDAVQVIEKMELTCVFKDVTWEMLNEPRFGSAIKRQFPEEKFTKLYTERNTIGERKNKEKRTASDDWPSELENESI